MHIQIQGLVTAVSKEWTGAKNPASPPYKKIRISFLNEEVPPLWCTVIGRHNWGYEHDRLIDFDKEVRVKPGHLIQLNGKFQENPKSFIVITDGSNRGGFKVLQEVRSQKYLCIPPWSITELDTQTWKLSAKNKDLGTFRGQISAGLVERPPRYKSLSIKGYPLVVGLNKKGIPNEFYFDGDADGTVYSYDKSASADKAWYKADGTPGRNP